ncbi:MAG: hypothetical protein WCR51_05550 [Planctomycetia bacterium]
MGAFFRTLVCLVLAAVAGIAATARAEVPAADAERDLERQPTWSIPTPADVQRRLFDWLERSPAAPESREAARRAWGDATAVPDLLDRVMAACAAADPRCAAILQDVDADHAWLADTAVDPFERDVASLWLGRECVRRDRFDDGRALLADLDFATAVDPAALLFHRAACEHWLLDADAALESLDRLLERAGEIPVRYERVARLLRADIAALEEESLDHIARRMRDITRRLDQGRAGPRTRAVQDGVIESLDKLIAKLEEQQQQCQSGGGGGGGSGRGGQGKPMDDSRIADGKGPGEVARRDLGGTDGWGNLPPHQRDEALQQIGREFPAHYREAIEQYFKRLAAGADAP